MTDTEQRQKTNPGDILAEKYRVERVLGQGGMGVVVLAEHIELRERVAIKFLLDEASDNPELAERFLREARAAVRIKSEHVVRVIDVGRLPSAAPYMVMEYLEGEDLAQLLLRGPVLIEDAVDYLIQCCEAMQVAHRAGIVHRDLKPANLFLSQRPDGSPLIKVLDFGISKIKQADATQLRLTQTQAMMGSPLYMSPEQMRSSKDVSPSADIWSLGVILHELITGDVPFIGATFPEVLVQVMSAEPPRLGTLRPGVPEGLEAVVLRCLEKDPGARFPSVAALGVALAPYGSPRTLGLQARLKNSVSQPPPALPAPPAPNKPLDMTRVGPGTPPSVLPLAALAQSDALPTRTNTAWGAQATDAARGGPSRRRRQVAIAASLLLVGGVAVVLALGEGQPAASSGTSPAPSSESSRAAAPAAAPPVAPPAASAPASPDVSENAAAAPRVAPALAAPAADPAGETPPPVATPVAPAAPPAVTAAARASARRAPTPAHPGASTKAGASQAGASARVTAGTAKPARTTASEPAPAPKAASVKARPKPLSIEFK